MADNNTSKAVHNLTDANFPRDEEGRVYHLGVKKGEVANRILSVGDSRRGQIIASQLDGGKFNHVLSSRGFHTYTGTKNGVPVTILTTGMGFPMMDFVVRECRAVVEGPMAFVRLGTCGAVDSKIDIGSICVAKESTFIRRNPDAWTKPNENIPRYNFAFRVPASSNLHQLYCEKLRQNIKEHPVVETLNATCDSFYSSQGRITEGFQDQNENVISDYQAQFPDAGTLEMETFHLLDLARCAKDITAAAAMIVLAQRKSNDFLPTETTHILERQGGAAALETLAEFPLENTMDTPDCVWHHLK